MTKKIIMILIAIILSISFLRAQRNDKQDVLVFNNNIIGIAIYMNQSLTEVSSKLNYSNIGYKYEDNLLIVDYECLGHNIRLWFTYNNDTENMIGALVKYNNNKQFKSIVKILNKKIYRIYDSKYCWGYYSDKYSYFVLIDINKKEKVIRFYLQ